MIKFCTFHFMVLLIVGLPFSLNASEEPAWPLNDTGVELWGDERTNESQIEPDDHPGQDASFGRDVTDHDNADGHAGFSFTKLDANGNPLAATAWTHMCVQDAVTGLIWEIRTSDGGLRDKRWTYTWYETDSTVNGGLAGTSDRGEGYDGDNCFDKSRCDTLKYIEDVNSAGLCGASDWRLPTVAELQSLVNYSRVEPAIDSDYFPDTQDVWYWSGTPNTGRDYARVVSFASGLISSGRKSYTYHVRLVRGGWLPEKPTALAASNIATSSFQANWEPVVTPIGYLLDVATDSNFTQPVSGFWQLDVGNVNYFAVSGLQAGTQYYYRVRAYNDAGEGVASSTISLQTTNETLRYTLSISKNGNGRVTSSPVGIDCGSNCSTSFTSGTTVTLTATPADEATFSGWGGACSGTATTCTLTLSAATSVLANFGGQLPEAPTALAVSAITTTGFQANWEAVSGALGYRLDIATDRAFTQSVADYWDLDTGNTQSFTVSGLQPGTQYYYRVRAYNDSGQGTASNTIGARTTSLASAPTLTVNTTGRGTVTSSPTGIDCGTSCSTTFTAGTQIALSATPESGATFIGWSGACSGTTSTCTVDLTTSQQVSAAFSDSATDRDAEGWRVTEIYIATLGYAPDNEGLQYWSGKLLTGGWTPLTVAQSFFDQPLVEAMYPADQGYGPFIEALYQNLFGRAPDQAGYDYWLGELEAGRVLRDQMIITLIEAGWTNPDAAADMARFGNRVQVGLAFAAEQAVRGILYSNLNTEEQARLRELGAQVLEGVTADESTRDAAILTIPDLLDTL